MASNPAEQKKAIRAERLALRDAIPAETRIEMSLAMAEQRLAGFARYRVQRIGTCFYTVAEGERFIAEARGAAWILTGFSGHGFKFGPLIAEALAEVVAGRSSMAHFQHWISGPAEVMQDAAPPA